MKLFSIVIGFVAYATLISGAGSDCARTTGEVHSIQRDTVDVFFADAAHVDSTVSNVRLERGRVYTLFVEGTYSIWASRYFQFLCAGQTEAAPMYASPRFQHMPVSMDAAYIFAAPTSSASWCDSRHTMPEPRDGWLGRTDPADPWQTPEPLQGTYSDSHVYTYAIRGKGHPLIVKVSDRGTMSDNYGKLKFVLVIEHS